MGFLDRIHRFVTGIGGGAQAIPGLVWDLARAPFVDDDVDGILGTINATVTSRTAQFAGNIFGPEEGFGAVIGAIPGREHLRGPLQTINRGLETAYREGVAEPLSMAFTAGSLADSPTWQAQQGIGGGPLGGIVALFDVDTWRKANEIAQSRSPGQALVLMFGTKDILDEEEVERFVGTDAYQFFSGSADALARLFLSPDVLAGKAVSASRVGRPAALGGRIGTVTERVAPQIGRRAEQFGTFDVGGRVARRIAAINNTIDRVYLRLPESVQRIVGREQTFTPEQAGRLARYEATRRQLRLERLMGEAATTTDPTRARVLRNIAETRQAREARIAAGAADVEALEATRSIAPETVRRFAEATQADIDAYFAAAARPRKGFFSGITRTPGWQRINDFIDELPDDVDVRAGLIRDRLFPNHHRGDIIARYLAEAEGPAEREFVMRVFLGDMRALDELKRSDWALGNRLADLMMEQAIIRTNPVLRPTPYQLTLDDAASWLDIGEDAEQLAAFWGVNVDDTLDPKLVSERLARIGEEIDAVRTEQERVRRLTTAWKSLPAGPSYSRGQQLRSAFKATAFYQRSFFGKGVRWIADMRPHHIVNTHDPTADAHLARMMREAGYDDVAIAKARGQFNALEPDQRGPAFERWIERTEHRILKEHGLDDDELEAVILNARIGRNQAKALLRSVKYDGEGRARLQIPDGDEILEMELPLTVTQLQNVVVVPNFHLLRKHAARYARLKYGDNWRAKITRAAAPAWSAKEYGLDAARMLMEVWRPLTLLRPAWTFRVIPDEQLRQVAKFGALTVGLESWQNLRNLMADLRTNPMVDRVLKTTDPNRAGRRGFVASALAGGAVAGPMGALAGGALGNRIVRKMAELEEAGYTNIRFGGHSISGPFGAPGTKDEIYRVLNSSREMVDEIFGRHENRWYGALRRDPGRWRTYTWGSSAQENEIYRAEWARNLRYQIAQDEMARQFLAGKTVDEVVDWLENTTAGRAYAAKVPWRSDKRAWAEAVSAHVEAYTGGIDDVKRGILALTEADVQKVTRRQARSTSEKVSDEKVAELLDLIPEEARAPIHGAETEQLLARSPLTQAINAAINHAFDVLGTMPTDNLSRNPTFRRFYQAEVRRLFASLEPGQVNIDDIQRLERQARDFALRETRELLYDAAEQSRFAAATRLLIPFYAAWQEVLTRWAGLAVENPVFAARARAGWFVPDKIGWTYTDDRGEKFIVFRLPEFARGIVNQGIFHSAVDSQGYVFIDKEGFNLVAQGTPGFGPFVQVAVSEMVERNPSLEDSVRFIIPFGPVDPVEAITPTMVRRFMAASQEDAAARANAEARIAITKMVQMANGEIPMVDFSDPAARERFKEEVADEAKRFMQLRTFTSFIAPVIPIYESPYKPYVDVYRALRDGDWKRAREVAERFNLPGGEALPTEAPEGVRAGVTTADDIFLDTFGEEFFAVTQSFTETLNGVPPTIEGMEAHERWKHLIDAYPEWGGVIAGYDGGGTAVKFSRAVYDRQMATGQRRRLPFDEVLDGPQKRLGWAHYSRYMDMIETLRVAKGLPNLQVRGAEQLRVLKQLVITGLARKYPAWYAEYAVTDRNAWRKRIEGARKLTEDPDLMKRPDIQGLAEYLRVRDLILGLLATRESKSLTASSNRDIAFIWQAAVSNLVERNPAFADLYYRKLENDPVELDDMPTLASVSSPGQE